MKNICALLLLLMVLPPVIFGQDFALKQLEESPRHHEWVGIESSGRTLHNFVAYPEKPENAGIVIVIHENRGLDDWARSFADQIAAAGYIAIAPDMISNTVSGIEKTSDFESTDAARQAIYALDADAITEDLKAVTAYAKSLDAGNGNIAILGFCWGGSQSFRFATNAGNTINMAIVFYGTGPQEQAQYDAVEIPVYGFYGGDDQRVNATIPASDSMMRHAGQMFEYEIYDNAGHAFMRRGDDPQAAVDDPNVIARNAAWVRLKELLNSL